MNCLEPGKMGGPKMSDVALSLQPYSAKYLQAEG